jgi:Holliday junction resolvasome RuvABC endonuclease subunit
MTASIPSGEVRVRVRRPDPPERDPAIWNYTGYPTLAVPARDFTVMGLDLSLTATGLACIRHGRLYPTTVSPGKHRGVERLAWFRERFASLIQLIMIEGYAFGAKMQRETMGELGAVARLACHDSGVPFHVVPPNSLKLFATGKGNGPKDTVSKELYKRFSVDLHDNNQVDAAGLAIMGLALREPDFTLTAFQQRALAVLHPGAKID